MAWESTLRLRAHNMDSDQPLSVVDEAEEDEMVR